MLSGHSFNALLKTLEEPPPHVKFLLATTDPQKLPVTILSRCLQFNLKNMPPERIVAHLQQILQVEQVQFEDAALWLLSRAANGSMRDALSLTDQGIAFGSGTLLEADVRAMLGSVDQQQVLHLLNAVAAGDARAVLDQVSAIAEYGVDFADVLAEVINVLHRVAVAQMLPDAIDNSLGDREAVLALAQSLNAEDTQLFYQIALNGRQDMPSVPIPRNGLEMTLLRMLAFRPVTPGEVALPEAASEVTQAPAAASAGNAVSGTPQDSAADHQLQQGSVEPSPGRAAVEPTLTATAHAEQGEPLLAQAKGPAENVAAAHSSDQGQVSDDRDAPEASDAFENGYAPGQSRDGDAAADWEQSYPAESALADDPPPWATDVPPEVAPPAASADPVVPEDRYQTLHPQRQGPADGASGDRQQGPAKKPDVPEPDAAGPGPAKQQSGAAELTESLTLMQLDARHWLSLVEMIDLSGMTYNIAANATVEAVVDNRVQMLLSARQFHLYNQTHQQRIEQALSDYFGQSVRIEIAEGDSDKETPAAYKERQRQARLAEAVASLQSDANVQAIVECFGGVVDVSSIRPVEARPVDKD